MIAAAALAVVLAASAPPAEPVDVWVADASGAPTVLLDVVPPGRLAALDAAEATITVDGAPVSAVTDIVPQDVVVALVVDDRPEVAAPALGASQGAAVELVRNLGAGHAGRHRHAERHRRSADGRPSGEHRRARRAGRRRAGDGLRHRRAGRRGIRPGRQPAHRSPSRGGARGRHRRRRGDTRLGPRRRRHPRPRGRAGRRRRGVVAAAGRRDRRDGAQDARPRGVDGRRHQCHRPASQGDRDDRGRRPARRGADARWRELRRDGGPRPGRAAAEERGGADDRGWCRAHHHERHERRAERPGHDARRAACHVAGDGRRDG